MSYNSKIHNRRSIRLKGYNYANAGLYFITICCEHRKHRFGKIENDEITLNEFGQIAYGEWVKLANRFINFELDVFQIMPNHMHGIIGVKEFVGAEFNHAQFDIDHLVLGQPQELPPQFDPDYLKKTVGDIVGAYKSLVANECLQICKLKNETMGKLWQRNYYEHIIRDEKAYQNISDYIINNPSKWSNDKFSSK